MADVDHPQHYNSSEIEVIDAIEAWDLGFCLGNVVKYVARAPHKGKSREDLKKALWYLLRELGLPTDITENTEKEQSNGI